MPNWQQVYAPQPGMHADEGLYRLLNDLNHKCIFKCTAGLSVLQYRCLDVYEHVQVGLNTPPGYEAHSILGYFIQPPERRGVPGQDCWYSFPDRYSWGQHSLVASWYMNSASEFRRLCDDYLHDPKGTVSLIYMTCMNDSVSLCGLLKAMCQSPSCDIENPRMTYSKQVYVSFENQRGIPRSISDHIAAGILAKCQRSRM